MCLNLKVTENVLLISARSGLLGEIGRSLLTSRSQTMIISAMSGVEAGIG